MCSYIKTGLMIAGEHLDFADLSAFIGLQPAATYVMRPETDHVKIIPKFRWKYHIGYAECDSVDARFEKLFEMIAGREEKVVEYCTRNGLDMYAECIIRIHQARPLIELSRSSLKKLSSLNANFEMDIYDFRKHVCSECFDRRTRSG